MMKWSTILFFLTVLAGKLTAQVPDTLSKMEIQGIVHMREEEKMARDIYDSMYAKWQVNPFGNIRKSEQVHMDRMKELLDEYGIKDPVNETSDKPGVFISNPIQQFYSESANSGSKTLIEALKVGAKVEELDIADLNNYGKQTTNKRLLATYEYLKMASENHLRAFVRRLRSNGVVYTPIILTKNVFDNIISKDNRE